MKTKEIEIDGKKYLLKEMLAKDVDDIDFNDKKKAAKTQVLLSTKLTDEEYDNLTFNQRLTLMKEINELNGIGVDFQKPAGV